MNNRIFLICPVRNATQEQKNKISAYIKEIEDSGIAVYYPARDTEQNNDFTGYRICSDNKNAMKSCDAVHIFWDSNSQGSLFDLGMAFMLGLPIKIINNEDVELKYGKCFQNMIAEWAMYSHDYDRRIYTENR